jgi:hypothetical protein
MSQKLLRNRIVEVGDEDIQFGQYRQNSVEEIESGQETVESEKMVSEIEGLESSQEIQVSESRYMEVPEIITPTTNITNIEIQGTSGFDMQALLDIMQSMNEQLNNNLEKQSEKLGNQIGSLKQDMTVMQSKSEKYSTKVGNQLESVKQEVGKLIEIQSKNIHEKLEVYSKEIRGKLNTQLKGTQEKLQIHVQEIKDQVQTQAKEIDQVSQECPKTDNKRQVEASEGILEPVKENRGKIAKNEGSIMKVSNELANLSLNVQQVHTKAEKEAEENQRRQRERNAKVEQQIKKYQSKVAEGLNKIEKEKVCLKQDLKTQIEVREAGNYMLAQLSAKDGLQTEPVDTQLEETMQIGMSKGVQGLGSGEFPPPTADENAGVKPVSHLRQLGEFFKFRGIQ